jgi:hypothetical protein
MAITLNQNMGKTDRLLRGCVGSFLLFSSILRKQKIHWRLLSGMWGGMLLLSGFIGFDPLLKKFGASTIPGAENDLANLLKQAVPGQGINPILTQQAVPQERFSKAHTSQDFASATKIQ